MVATGTGRAGAASAVQRGAAVPARDVEERRLLVPVEGDQALLVDGGLRPRVAAVPVGPDPELLDRPVDRAAEPGLGRVHAEVEVHEVLLELEGALLFDRTVAV